MNKGGIPVRVFNPQSKPVRIYKGDTIGKLCPLLETDQGGKSEDTIPRLCYHICRGERQRNTTTNGNSEANGNEATSSTSTGRENNKERMKEMADLFKIDDPSFSIEQKKMVYNILSRHSGAISRGKSDLGDLKTSQHFIDTGEARPIRVPVRRLPYHQREEARKEIETMLASNVIEASESPWSAPVVMVRKKDGTLRFCVDYRKLNQVTKKDVYPLPRCDDVLEALSGAIFFTHLDLVRGYWQLGVNKVDREKTAFSTPEGHFQFKRMPFGLTNAPATFQRAMNTILNGLTWTDCLVYLDDIVIFARDFQEHNRRLEAVLERLETAGVKLYAKKCELLKTETLILEHVVARRVSQPIKKK